MWHLIWTDHAIQRVAERIGFDPDILIPKDRLLKTGSVVPDHTAFRQKIGPVIYVCKRDGSRVVILTVVAAEQNKNRIKCREYHYSRKSKRVYTDECGWWGFNPHPLDR